MIALQVDGRSLSIECQWVEPAACTGALPPIVFLHEGLGSVSMWRDFPQQLCNALGRRGLVYSRPGYGRSTPRPAAERWGPDFMQFQAVAVLPRLLEAAGIDGDYLLFGHSDGGTIALIHAAIQPRRVEAVVVLAPHIMVEDISVASIAAARVAYLEGDLRERLKRHHADVDSAFFGWADVWLSAEFRSWTIEPLLSQIQAPVLAVQGLDDEYGSLAQVQGIARQAPRAQWQALADCGHSPHREQPAALLLRVRDWLRANSGHG